MSYNSHFLSGFNGLVEWRLAYNRADRDEPDIREVLYVFNDSADAYRLRDQTQSGFRQFIESSEKIWEPKFDQEELAAVKKNCLLKCSSTCFYTMAYYYNLSNVPEWVRKHVKVG